MAELTNLSAFVPQATVGRILATIIGPTVFDVLTDLLTDEVTQRAEGEGQQERGAPERAVSEEFADFQDDPLVEECLLDRLCEE